MDRYTNIQIKKSPNGKQMYKTVRYPEVPRSEDDTYVYTTIGDKFDQLAQEYYGDSSLWWVISIANSTLTQNSLTPKLGSQIRIPSNIAPILAEYEVINR
jgi:nucleoid-associated protein YgaU